MDLVINEDNLQIKEVEAFNSKSRAILIDDNTKILVANYGGVFLLPGGSIDKKETPIEALIRELNEEIGISYKNNELNYLTYLEYYQKNYPKRDGTFQNRLVKIYYFVGKFKEISLSSQVLTNKEKKDKFRLELISIEELERKVLENTNDNPRNIYFQNEILEVLRLYNNIKQSKSLVLKK